MDSKQFERLQEGVQWVVDEQARDAEELGGTRSVKHLQRRWAVGKPLAEFFMAKSKYDREVDQKVNVVCASACCLAGNIVSAHGETFISFMDRDIIERLQGDNEEINVEFCVTDEGYIERVGLRAAQLAGLNVAEADSLFNERNTADDIVKRATEIAAEHGHELVII